MNGAYLFPPARRAIKITGARWAALAVLGVAALALNAAETWQSALSRMPLPAGVPQLNRTNCVETLLRSFQSNDVVKALIFMPGATDELYFFRRARANLPLPPVSLLAAVNALTNQTLIRATFRPPLLLLHTAEDLLEPAVTLKHPSAVERLRQARFAPHVLYLDRDWDCLQPLLSSALAIDLRPQRYSRDSWHFYRHSFAAWNLTGWEALEATALAGQTRFTVRRRQVVFELDMRPRVAPRVESYPP